MNSLHSTAAPIVFCRGKKESETVQSKTESVEMHSSSLYASSKNPHHVQAKNEAPEYASISEAKK